jgi:hypothetical protein
MWKGVSGKDGLLWNAAYLFAVSTVCAVFAAKWLGRPFPGFLLNEAIIVVLPVSIIDFDPLKIRLCNL